MHNLAVLFADYLHEAAMDAFVSVVAGTVSPIEFFDPTHIDRLLHVAA